MPRPRKGQGSSRQQAAIERLIRAIVGGCATPAEALELYYWSREPGLIEIIRGIAAMPEETRASLEAFLALARGGKEVTGNLNRLGVLTLTSAEATKTVALAQYATEGDDAPRVLN